MKCIIMIFSLIGFLFCPLSSYSQNMFEVVDGNKANYLKLPSGNFINDYSRISISTLGNKTAELIKDTMTQYLDRSTGFNLYGYKDQNQVLRPITGTNNVYHLLGAKYEVKSVNIIGILVAFGVMAINEPADSLAVLISAADEATGLPINPIIANTGFSVLDIDTNSSTPVFTPILLKEPAALNGKFAILVQVWTQTDESDLVVVFSNNQGDANGENSAFLSVVQEQGIQSLNFDEFNVIMNDGNRPNFDLMILPVIEFDVTKNEEYTNINGMEIKGLFPNPVSDKASLKFKLSKLDDVNLMIVDIKGKTIKKEKLTNMIIGENQIELNLSDLISGDYFFIISTGGKKIAGKFVKL